MITSSNDTSSLPTPQTLGMLAKKMQLTKNDIDWSSPPDIFKCWATEMNIHGLLYGNNISAPVGNSETNCSSSSRFCFGRGNPIRIQILCMPSAHRLSILPGNYFFLLPAVLGIYIIASQKMLLRSKSRFSS